MANPGSFVSSRTPLPKNGRLVVLVAVGAAVAAVVAGLLLAAAVNPQLLATRVVGPHVFLDPGETVTLVGRQQLVTRNWQDPREQLADARLTLILTPEKIFLATLDVPQDPWFTQATAFARLHGRRTLARSCDGSRCAFTLSIPALTRRANFRIRLSVGRERVATKLLRVRLNTNLPDAEAQGEPGDDGDVPPAPAPSPTPAPTLVPPPTASPTIPPVTSPPPSPTPAPPSPTPAPPPAPTPPASPPPLPPTTGNDRPAAVGVAYYRPRPPVGGALLATTLGDPASAWPAPTLVDGATGDVGVFPAAALDQGGSLHVSYYDAKNGNLKYATNAGGGGWRASTVATEGDVGVQSDIAVDASGGIHIAFADASAGSVRYAVRPSGAVTWTAETVAAEGLWPALALDGAGTPHVSYASFAQNTSDAPGFALSVASRAGGRWTPRKVDESAPARQRWVSGPSAIAADPRTNVVHLVYQSTVGAAYPYGAGILQYATSASGFRVTTVRPENLLGANSLTVGQFVSLALDPAGNPVIAYFTPPIGAGGTPGCPLSPACGLSGYWVTALTPAGQKTTLLDAGPPYADANGGTPIDLPTSVAGGPDGRVYVVYTQAFYGTDLRLKASAVSAPGATADPPRLLELGPTVSQSSCEVDPNGEFVVCSPYTLLPHAAVAAAPAASPSPAPSAPVPPDDATHQTFTILCVVPAGTVGTCERKSFVANPGEDLVVVPEPPRLDAGYFFLTTARYLPGTAPVNETSVVSMYPSYLASRGGPFWFTVPARAANGWTTGSRVQITSQTHPARRPPTTVPRR